MAGNDKREGPLDLYRIAPDISGRERPGLAGRRGSLRSTSLKGGGWGPESPVPAHQLDLDADVLATPGITPEPDILQFGTGLLRIARPSRTDSSLRLKRSSELHGSARVKSGTGVI